MTILDLHQVPLGLQLPKLPADAGEVLGGIPDILGNGGEPEQTGKPIDDDGPPDPPEPKKKPPVRARRLSYNQDVQKQTNWCWAAVASSIGHFYNPSSRIGQCELVNAQRGLQTCCGDGSTSECNRVGFVDEALTRVGNFDHTVGSSVSFQEVREQINLSRPLAVRVAWSGGGAHAVVLEGWRGTTCVWVEDPWYGTSEYDFEKFRTAYQNTGTWTHSWFTNR